MALIQVLALLHVSFVPGSIFMKACIRKWSFNVLVDTCHCLSLCKLCRNNDDTFHATVREKLL